MDQGRPAHHLTDLVALEMADEVEGRAVVGAFRQLGRHLLDPVFPQSVNAGGDGRLAGGGIVHLAGPHQEDLPRVPARRPGGPVHPLPDGADVFRYGCH